MGFSLGQQLILLGLNRIRLEWDFATGTFAFGVCFVRHLCYHGLSDHVWIQHNQFGRTPNGCIIRSEDSMCVSCSSAAVIRIGEQESGAHRVPMAQRPQALEI